MKENFSDEELIRLIKESGYENALYKVLKTRVERKKIYGDGWKSDPDWAILAEIRQKYKRLEKFIIGGGTIPEGKVYEGAVDTLVDLSNYANFLLEILLVEKDNK
jgi:hypothetical protein